MSKIIVIDPGHGGTDPGAIGNGLREKDLTLDISKRTKKYLEDNYTGNKVILTRTNDKYLTLAERAAFANRNNADLFVSMHINAGGGTGYESFIHTNTQSATSGMQNQVHASAMKEMKVVDRGKKRANFAVLRLTRMPAILPENLFIDRKEDATKLKQSSFIDKVAKGHAEGIAKALRLKKKPTSKPSKPAQNKPQSKDIAEDGWFGPATARKAQQVYGLKIVDGIVSGQPKNSSTRNIPSARYGSTGSNLIKAMAKEFGVPVRFRDGKITVPSMLIEAMQKHYGTPVDKKLSGPSLVIKEWQKALNKGKRK